MIFIPINPRLGIFKSSGQSSERTIFCNGECELYAKPSRYNIEQFEFRFLKSYAKRGEMAGLQISKENILKIFKDAWLSGINPLEY